MLLNNRTQPRNENPNYVAYFYDSGIIQRYLAGQNQTLMDLTSQSTSVYDFSSALVPTPGRARPTVEQIIAHGYLAVPRVDPVDAILSDREHTARLGLDDVISQVRRRYELYHQNMVELDIAKCAAANCLHYHEAYHGPADSKIAYAVNKRLDGLYRDQRAERINLWRDVSRLRLELPENAQNYLTAYRKRSILEDTKGDEP